MQTFDVNKFVDRVSGPISAMRITDTPATRFSPASRRVPTKVAAR